MYNVTCLDYNYFGGDNMGNKKLENLGLMEYSIILNERILEMNEFRSKYNSLAKKLKSLLEIKTITDKLKIIANELFKEHFPPMKGRKGFLIDGNEYKISDNGFIECRRYRCHTYYEITYFSNSYGNYQPRILTIFKNYPEIYLFFKNMITKMDKLHEQFALNKVDLVKTEKNLTIDYFEIERWGDDIGARFKNKDIEVIRSIIVKESNYNSNEYELSTDFDLDSYSKEFLIDDEYYKLLLLHCDNVYLKLNNTYDKHNQQLNKLYQEMLDSEYGPHLIAAGI